MGQPRWETLGLLAATALAATLSAGCAGRTAEEGEPGERTVTLYVENRNWQDATIYVQGAGQPVRLGTVTSMTVREFLIPPAMYHTSGIRLVAELVGSSARKATDRIVAGRGDAIDWTLENQLSLSTYWVW